ncbi:hypothetical protein [Salibacterium salarium]|uniref:hypothetical protein n=1 Tax=Salibacterium salarium TaxID=284579 RepID=UPI00163ABCCD|nr:hypothetical protein [Salibacterium salarium]
MSIIRLLVYSFTGLTVSFVFLSFSFPVLAEWPLAAALSINVPLFAVYLGIKHRS